MRDRETDSWWSIMTSDAIGGELAGADLEELPIGEKIQWGDWVAKHPETLVLSVDGTEHIEQSPYTNYFTSDGTFRDLKVKDKRLAPKEPIFGGWINDRPQAVAHSTFAGGKVLALDDGRSLLLYRPAGAEIFASSRVYLLSTAPPAGASATDLLSAIDAGELAGEAVSGFDTYWYSWVTVNEHSGLLR